MRFSESPRWLFIHGREEEGERIVAEIEKQIVAETGEELDEPETSIHVHQRERIPFREILGLNAEGKALEDIVEPMTADDADGEEAADHDHDSEPAPERGGGIPDAREGTGSPTTARARQSYRPGPGTTFYAPRMSMSASDPGYGDLSREVARIAQALLDRGSADRAALAQLVGARRWGPGRFTAALRAAIDQGRVTRRGRRTFAPGPRARHS